MESNTVPPQKWNPPPVWMEACHGIGPAAACPPTILLVVMKLGMLEPANQRCFLLILLSFQPNYQVDFTQIDQEISKVGV